MNHIVCLIHRDYLTIERNNSPIGEVREIDGEPTILLDSFAINGKFLPLTFNDIEIIEDNWSTMKELSEVINKAIDKLP